MQRLEDFLMLLAEDLKAVDEATIKEEYFATQEWFDLFTEALDKAWRTRSREKHILYARILAGSASVKAEHSLYSPEEYLYLVSSLTPKEIEVAREIYEFQKGQPHKEWDPARKEEVWNSQVEEISRIAELNHNDLTLILNRLASAGLVETSISMRASGNYKTTYWVSSAFERLMEFISSPL